PAPRALQGPSGQPSCADRPARRLSAQIAPSNRTARPSFSDPSGVLTAARWISELVSTFPLPATQISAEPASGSIRPKRLLLRSPWMRTITLPLGRIAVGDEVRMPQMSYSPGSTSRVPRGRIVTFPYDPGVIRTTWRSFTSTSDPPHVPPGIEQKVGTTGSVAGETVPLIIADGA